MKKIFAQLYPNIPASFNDGGIALVFTGKLNRRQRAAVFERFPWINGIETAAGYFQNDCWPQGDCLANRVRAAIARECHKFNRDCGKAVQS